MIKFTNIHIQNFKSIKEATLEYKSGVWEIVGQNNDSEFSSNGSGKTTVMEAIQQCLFNKTVDAPPIDDVNRKHIGDNRGTEQKYYKITLTFLSGSDVITVINDRKNMNIHVLVNEVDQKYKSISTSLTAIQRLLGMDFNTFTTITFISHDTIINLIDKFSASSLMKVVLNFREISDFEKRSREKVKQLKAQLYSIAAQLQTVEDALLVLAQFIEIDTKPLQAKKLHLLTEIDKTQKAYIEKKQKLEDDIANIRSIISVTTANAKGKEKLINSNICECCGTLLNISEEELSSIRTSHSDLLTLLQEKELEEEHLQEQLSKHITEYKQVSAELQDSLSNIESAITVAFTKNQMYYENRDKKDDLRKQKTALERTQDLLTEQMGVLETAILIIKSGDIQNSMLSTFIEVLNIHLTNFSTFVSLTYINVSAYVRKNSVSFRIHDTRFNHNLSIHSLSGGEKTRLRLIILLAMLQTIKDLTDISTNIVFFDESLDTLDTSATKDLAILFDYLVNIDEKFIGLVSHGGKLDEIQFTGKIHVEKTDGISVVTTEEYQ